MTAQASSLFTVTDLKQFTYCPRVVFYGYCLPLLRPETFKMQESHRAHDAERAREARRSLRVYGLADGDSAAGHCRFDVSLRSDTLGLTGRTDLVIETETEAIPVEYKDSMREAGRHVVLQVTAYGLLLEEAQPLPARRGFVYSISLRRAEEVPITPARRAQVRRMVAAMRDMVEREQMPGPPQGRGRCVACEFRRFCNDL